MLRIRLRRAGRRGVPAYRIVVAEATAPVKGKYIDALGYYNPKLKQLEVKKEKLFEWLDKGAIPSNTVARLLISKGIKDSRIVYVPRQPKPKKEKVKKEETEKAPATPESPEKTESPGSPEPQPKPSSSDKK